MALAGAALTLQQGAAFVLQGQLNTSLAAEAAATSAEDEARATLTNATSALADALAAELDKKSILTQITDLGNTTRAAGDPNKQLALIEQAISEAAADADAVSARVANAAAAKAAAEAEVAKLAAAQDVAEAKADSINAVVQAAANDTAVLQVGFGGQGCRILWGGTLVAGWVAGVGGCWC